MSLKSNKYPNYLLIFQKLNILQIKKMFQMLPFDHIKIYLHLLYYFVIFLVLVLVLLAVDVAVVERHSEVRCAF